jgi:hypothetical protein
LLLIPHFKAVDRHRFFHSSTMGAARVSILRHKPRSVRARRVSASVIASPRQRARIYQNAPPRGVEDCGAPSGRDPFFWWAASRRPALAAISSRLPPSYLTQLAQAKPKGRASPDDRRFPRRCVERRPLRLVRYPDGGSGPTELVVGRSVRRHLRRRTPRPKIQTVCSSRPQGRGMEQV